MLFMVMLRAPDYARDQPGALPAEAVLQPFERCSGLFKTAVRYMYSLDPCMLPISFPEMWTFVLCPVLGSSLPRMKPFLSGAHNSLLLILSLSFLSISKYNLFYFQGKEVLNWLPKAILW